MRGGSRPRSPFGLLDEQLERKARRLIERYEETGRLDPKEVTELDTLRALHRLAGPPRRGRPLFLMREHGG